MTKFFITLQYRNKRYSFSDKFEDRRLAEYVIIEGNYACDCNRSLFIGRYCDHRFADMPCGHTINLVSIREAEVKQPRLIRKRQCMIAKRRRRSKQTDPFIQVNESLYALKSIGFWLPA